MTVTAARARPAAGLRAGRAVARRAWRGRGGWLRASLGLVLGVAGARARARARGSCSGTTWCSCRTRRCCPARGRVSPGGAERPRGGAAVARCCPPRWCRRRSCSGSSCSPRPGRRRWCRRRPARAAARRGRLLRLERLPRPAAAARPVGAAARRTPGCRGRCGRRPGAARRLALALLPAAVGGFQAMLVSAPRACSGGRRAADGRGRRPGAARARCVAARGGRRGCASLPWAVPALASGAVDRPGRGGRVRGAGRRAVRHGWAACSSLGGIWNAEAGVPGQGEWWSATVRLRVVARRGRRLRVRRLRVARAARPGVVGAGWRSRRRPGSRVAAPARSCPGALRALIGWWPGFGPLRDGQVYLAPLVLLEAAGCGLLAARVLRRRPASPAGLAGGRGGAARRCWCCPASRRARSAGWRRWTTRRSGGGCRRMVNGDPAPGALLSLPWGAHRAFALERRPGDARPGDQAVRPPGDVERRAARGPAGRRRAAGRAARTRWPAAVGRLLAGDGPTSPRRCGRAGCRYVLHSGT